MKPVEIQLLGKKYYFRSDNPEGLLETAKYLEEQLEELNKRFNTVDQSKLFAMYSLMITEKFFTEKENNKKLNNEIEQINKLLSGMAEADL
ncbi:MAG: cell division protein ZapA [Candidatus Cloacimonadales bacterium]|nr:cell division protein ZapA [Candidatus Cloacimonadales bacterium]